MWNEPIRPYYSRLLGRTPVLSSVWGQASPSKLWLFRLAEICQRSRVRTTLSRQRSSRQDGDTAFGRLPRSRTGDVPRQTLLVASETRARDRRCFCGVMNDARVDDGARIGRWWSRCGPAGDRGSGWWPIWASSSGASKAAGRNWVGSFPESSPLLCQSFGSAACGECPASSERQQPSRIACLFSAGTTERLPFYFHCIVQPRGARWCCAASSSTTTASSLKFSTTQLPSANR